MSVDAQALYDKDAFEMDQRLDEKRTRAQDRALAARQQRDAALSAFNIARYELETAELEFKVFSICQAATAR